MILAFKIQRGEEKRKNRAAETRRKNREGLSKRLSAIVTITRLRVAEEERLSVCITGKANQGDERTG